MTQIKNGEEKIEENINGFTFVFREKDFYVKEIKEEILKNIERLEDFYKIKVSDVIIEFCYSREEFEKKTLYKNSPEWLIGVAENNKIFLISPFVVERISNHKKDDLLKIAVHELCHIFNYEINSDILMWLDEGVALFLAKQEKRRDYTKEEFEFFINNILYKKIKLNFFAENNGYKISYWLVTEIYREFGEEFLLDLIKDNRNGHKYKNEIKGIINLIYSLIPFLLSL